MEFKIPDEVKKIMSTFQKNNFEIYLVGGAVRDILIKRMVIDWDFTTNATPEEIQNLFEDSFYENTFGTVGIAPKDPDFKPHEVTTFRKEAGYSDNRRPDKVEWGESIEDDLTRRDFTLNAIALKPINLKDNEYELIDPYEGQIDLKNKLIRAVGDPNDRFSEDALRMMRAVRIAAELGFEIEEDTFEAIKMNSKLIQKIAKERVRDELLKIVASSYPYEGIMMFKNSGLMEEILPELEKTFGVDQKSPQRHHIYDVGTHSLMSLKNCNSTDPITRFATLIHDIGKPQTYKKRNGVTTFYNHEIAGATIAKNIAERLRFSRKDTGKLIRLVRYHQFTVDENQTDSAIRRFIRNVTPEYIDDMLELRRADRIGSGARETSWRTEDFKKKIIEVQKQPFSIKDLKIDGSDVMKELNIKPGPKVGEVLKKIFKKVEDKKVENKKSELMKLVREME